jgi:hypothetical protein
MQVSSSHRGDPVEDMQETMVLPDASPDGVDLVLGDVMLFLSLARRDSDIAAGAVGFAFVAGAGGPRACGESLKDGPTYSQRQRSEFLQQTISLAPHRRWFGTGRLAHVMTRIIAYLLYAIQTKTQNRGNEIPDWKNVYNCEP